MSRYLPLSLLTLALLGSFAAPLFTTAARADDWTIEQPTNTTGATTNTTTENPIPTAATPQPAAASKPAKAIVAKKLDILSFIKTGDASSAEAGYLDWSSAWHEDDFSLLANAESLVLRKMAEQGNTNAFVAQVQAGDPNAMTALRDMIKANKVTLSAEQFATAIAALGKHGNSAVDLPVLAVLFSNSDPSIVNAAISAAGDLGDYRAMPYFHILLGDADLKRSLLIAHTMIKMGATQEVVRRYTLQMNSTLGGVPERAALLLTVSGNKQGWAVVKKMLDTKQAPYYPFALCALGTMPDKDVQPYVEAGLKGSEQEQLAALQSIAVLPEEKIDSTLKAMALDDKAPKSVRLAAVNQMIDRNTKNARIGLRDFASMLQGGDSGVKAAAIRGLQQCGLLTSENVRTVLYIQMQGSDAQVALAARSALLGFAYLHMQ